MEISNYLKNEHRTCDTLFASTEEAIATQNWSLADEKFIAFSNDTLLHFKKEEEELFPTFEAQTGMTQGPTQVMRFEHEQVKGLIDTLGKAIKEQKRDDALSIAESMMILLQQHNMKEEQMLYAMCDQQIPHDVKQNSLKIMKEMTL